MTMRISLAPLVLLTLLGITSAQHTGWCPAAVCFALSGIEADSFNAQKNVIGGALQHLSSRPGPKLYAGVQYTTEALGQKAISRLTSEVSEFKQNLTDAAPNFGQPFPTSGLNYCFSQLLPGGRRGDGPQRIIIVVLGNGQSDVGADPQRRAQLFRAVGGKTFSVGVGGGLDWKQLQGVAGNGWRTLYVADSTPWQTGIELGKRICMTDLS